MATAVWLRTASSRARACIVHSSISLFAVFEASEMRINCLGCGVDLPNAKDRRALSSSDAEDVVNVWKIFIDNEEVEEEVVDRILSGGDCQRLPKMCKKCFTAYRTCHKYHQSIQSNLRKAMKSLELVPLSSGSEPPPPKRPRLSKPESKITSVCQPSGSGVNVQSPDIAVGTRVNIM